MPRSIGVRQDLLPRVELAVKRNGFLRKKDLAEAVGLADSTVRNFLNGTPVDYATFVEICRKLNLEWRDFADLGEAAKPHQESGEVLDASANGLSCKQEVDYRCYRLGDLLAASQWLQADRETLDILLKVSGREKERWLRVEDIQKISCQVLRTIDQLWVEYSQQRFGLSIQQKLIQLSFGDTDIEAWLQFTVRVGWRKNNNLWLTWPELQAKREIWGSMAKSFSVGFFPYQYSLGSKIYRGAIGDWREPSPVSAFLLLHRDF